MPKSFRKDIRSAPSRYRTPSPPRDAIEPISPTSAGGDIVETLDTRRNEDARTLHTLKRPCPTSNYTSRHASGSIDVHEGAMDAFASIALATDSTGLIQSNKSGQILDWRDQGPERPSKRAKSEKLYAANPSRDMAAMENRPATSYEQSSENRKLEAELLLNFAQAAAKLTTPSPVLPHTNIRLQRGELEARDQISPEKTTDCYSKELETHGNIENPKIGITVEDIDFATLPASSEIAITESSGLGFPSDDSGATNSQPVIIHEDKPWTREPERINTEALLVVDSSLHDEVDLIPESVGLQREETSRPDTFTSEPEKSRTVESQTFLADARSLTDKQIGRSSVEGNSVGESRDPAQHETGTLSTSLKPSQTKESDAMLKDELTEGSNAQWLQQLPEEDVHNDSGLFHAALDHNHHSLDETNHSNPKPAGSPVTIAETGTHSADSEITPFAQSQPAMASAVCTACKFVRNSIGIESENSPTSWINCDACKAWFHFACAGFKNEREVRSVDKFRCRKCKPIHGATTYVRKSSRAHSAIDYAGLHQGVIKTSDERPEHHYIKPIKEGTITFLPESFARMRPELVTAEYFEKGVGMKEPVVIPAELNPRSTTTLNADGSGKTDKKDSPVSSHSAGAPNDCSSCHPDSEIVPDHGQDALDMVIPQGLTVRQVAELYGPDEKVEVIDVKSQNGENRKWNMRRWADYYENPNNKVVRNVISLEVSQSRLGRLIRRPQIVRDLDLQDSVWPEELLAKGEHPRVQFYCLMSVADCFTDFHIDFGGSSVFYHILKGKKTFLFIPPKEKNLKKYEEWCQSPAQNWTFLGDQTKECYRVDLSEGDTMLIPSGWIHAVWTPEDSLVIGGNFLTRMNFGMQLRIAQVEKATGVARKFRYPHFQKLQWYTAFKYLETDPLPDHIRELLHAGGSFNRERPTHHDFDSWGENSRAGVENYHARYYSQSELDGLPDLMRYLLRTALIDIGSITDGISADTRNAVRKSIPRSFGEPLNVLKTFAAWCAWKRGNEPIPHWAYPDAVPEDLSPDKLSAAATKKLDREAALSAPRRQSARMQSQQQSLESVNQTNRSGVKRDSSQLDMPEQIDEAHSSTPKKPRNSLGGSLNSHRKTACESCRKRRRACKHKEQVALLMAAPTASDGGINLEGTPISSQTQILPYDMGMSDPFVNSTISPIRHQETVDTDQKMVSIPHACAVLGADFIIGACC